MRQVVGLFLGTALWMQAPSARAAGEDGPSEGEGARTHDVERVEPATRTRDRNAGARLGLIIGGSVALTAFYGLPCATGAGLWCVPVAGPVLVLAKREREQSGGDDGEDGIVPPSFVYALAGGLGMLQLAGGALVITGALLPRREVTERVGPVAFLPLLSSSTAGLAAVGTW